MKDYTTVLINNDILREFAEKAFPDGYCDLNSIYRAIEGAMMAAVNAEEKKVVIVVGDSEDEDDSGIVDVYTKGITDVLVEIVTFNLYSQEEDKDVQLKKAKDRIEEIRRDSNYYHIF